MDIKPLRMADENLQSPDCIFARVRIGWFTRLRKPYYMQTEALIAAKTHIGSLANPKKTPSAP